MVQSYQDSIQANKSVGSAQRINQNYGLEVSQAKNQVDVANKSKVQKFIQGYIDQGYSLSADGSLSKTVGNVTTVVDVNKDSGVVNVKTVTATETTRGTTQYEQILAQYNKLDRQITNAERKGQSLSQGVYDQRDYLYTQMRNLQNSGSAFYTVVEKSEKSVAQDLGLSVFDSKGQGYSVAPVLQKSFLENKEQSYKNKSIVVDQNVSGSFVMPRSVSPQESVYVPSSLDLSKVQVPSKSGGVIDIRRESDFATFNDKVSPVDKLSTSLLSLNQNNNEPLQSLGVVGIAAGVGAVKRGIEYKNNPLELVKTVGTGVAVAVLPEAILPAVAVVGSGVLAYNLAQSKSILELGENIGSNTYDFAILSASTSGSKLLMNTNKFTKFDVQMSAYDLSSSGEKAPLYIKENNVVANPEFNPINKLTVDVSSINKNKKYFSSPEIDVPAVRSYDLAGVEIIPSKNEKGVLPLIEQTIAPFESNKLTIEQIGKKPLIDAVSTAQSRMVDLPISKSMQGTPVVDLMNPDRSSFVSMDLKQTTLIPIENKISSVPKGSIKPFIYDKVASPDSKSVIDNSEFFSGDTVSVSEKVSLDMPSRSFGSENKLVVNSDYVLNKETGSYDRIVGSSELNLDIKGKVSPQRFGSVSVLNVGSSIVEQPKLILNNDQNSILKSNVKSVLDNVSDVSNVQDQNLQQKSRISLFQGSDQIQTLKSAQTTDRSMILNLKQVQDPIGQNLYSEQGKNKEVIKPIIPKPSQRQSPSGKGMFSVLVRKQGKFVKIGSGYSDLATAFNRGKQEIKNTASVSFKVVNSFGIPEKVNIQSDKTLRFSKSDSSVVVQKNTFRISSLGEKNEISRKGQNAQRKSIKKSRGVFG